MNKLFNALSKPAKWVLIIGSLFYAVWFAVEQAGSIDGTFMSVVTHLIILIVGTALLLATPILLLLKKDAMAKIAFLILAGYWLISTIQELFGYAEAYAVKDFEALGILAGVFAFITGLGLVAVLTLIILEFAMKKPGLRLFTFLVMFGVIFFSLLTGIFLFAFYLKWDQHWTITVNHFIKFLLLPALVSFGCLYFLGAPAGKSSSAE